MQQSLHLYETVAKPEMVKMFGYKNPMEMPRILKVSVNMGIGEAIQNGKLLEQAVEQLSNIAGQKAVITRAKKSINQFKLRKGMAIGCMVTLRRARMWNFIDKLFNIALPRVRDFKGISFKGFDGRGNFTFGIKEQIIFPEVDYDKIEKPLGMNITVVTSARTDEEARALLKLIGAPFKTNEAGGEGGKESIN